MQHIKPHSEIIAKFFQKTETPDIQTLIVSDLTLKKLISLCFAGNPFVIVNKCRFEQVKACLMRFLTERSDPRPQNIWIKRKKRI